MSRPSTTEGPLPTRLPWMHGANASDHCEHSAVVKTLCCGEHRCRDCAVKHNTQGHLALPMKSTLALPQA